MKTRLFLFTMALIAQSLFAQPAAKPDAAKPDSSASTALTPLSAAAAQHLKSMASLFDGKTLAGWQHDTNAWIVKDGAMASTGAGRGVICTKSDYTNFRLIFQMRHVSGQPDHQACVLIFCSRPTEGQKPLDALAGIQFQVPNGGHWDYRPGHNNSGGAEFTKMPHPAFDPHEWSQVELLVNAEKGTGRMAVAQPVGTKAVEVLEFNEPTAGKRGPIAWQMHNKGLFDEYKNVLIETDPKDDKLITVE
jgi:hypothetical protein